MTLKEIDESKLTPMMKQYLAVKKKYKNHILFYRLGDFYEMFFDDALIVSKELELTLTGRDCGLEERAPMCGVPFHACDVYLKKLIEKGHMVAICEQTKDPSECQGLVPRDVIRVVTPGTLIESSMLDESSNNYLCAFYMQSKEAALCLADISTGEVHLFDFTGKDTANSAINELSRFAPSEILINDAILSNREISAFIREKIKTSVQLLEDADFDPANHTDEVLTQFSVNSLDSLGLKADSLCAYAVCGLFAYIHETQKALVGRFSEITRHDADPIMTIGFTARRNLELTETLRNKQKKGSLLWVISNTKTSMGNRMLKSWLEQPLINPAKIIDRLNAVEQLVRDPVSLGEIREVLSGVYDLERLMTRVMYRSASPRDLKSLSLTALKLPELKRLLSAFDGKLIKDCTGRISTLDAVSNLVENAIVDEPPANVKDGGVIREGFNEQLDGLRNIISGGKGLIDDIAEREKEKTGIKNLKIGYNRVFGYYIEVTKSYYDLIPDHYIRKQTLANCERFITDELKVAENTILGASDKILTLEQEIFGEVREFIATQLRLVQETATAVAEIDVLCSYATASIKNNYTKPEIAIDGIINIKNGRHPVVELMQQDEVFVPNDTYLDLTGNRMAVITGPNMSGKSTYMRQVALITLMAQIGCFVPADYAKISVVDQIFTRIGASDDLTAGQSTFMVEMSEVADIVKHATKNSLVILDEVGRGTSTFDGIAIARAVSEFISTSRSLGCKTLFATHYHELIALEDELEGVKNYSVAVKRQGDNIKFLRKIVKGGADESFGIEVAKLAGLPNKIIGRAKSLLGEMEAESIKAKAAVAESDSGQISFDRISDSIVTDKLRKTNIDEMNDEELREFVKDLLRYV
ncbi:DNA mismatch repair protein MutS [Ruminococcus albus]|uniref:DNA mismatch repair protein MutS n=1 Tax=Ruminococcus albus TaxID=1264 RepID=A0A1H7F8Q2_RUMAL|nr:DNA mismatch repair protein MutS [Ruminococcus albus]SEK22503.1 DNA mismatch repair protein MutS [Ruminococcus albus]